MNTTGCSVGWARDEVFMLPVYGRNQECAVHLAVYCTFISLVVLAKAAMAVFMTKAWMKRHDRILKSTDPKKVAEEKKRLPIVPASVALSFVTYVLLFITTSLNIANTGNGIAYLLYGIGWTLCLALFSFYVMKIIGLGVKLAVYTPEAVGMDFDPLRVMNLVQKLMFSGQLVALAAQALVFIVLVPVYAPNTDLLVRVGFALQALELFLIAGSVSYHIERVIAMVKRMRINTVDPGANTENKPSRDATKHATWKLRVQQIIILCVALPVMMLTVLEVALILPTHWYAVYVNMVGDAFCNFAFWLTTTQTTKSNAPGTSPYQANHKKEASASSINPAAVGVMMQQEPVVVAAAYAQQQQTRGNFSIVGGIVPSYREQSTVATQYETMADA